MIETTNNQSIRSTQDAGELLTRIDAILDELYALREAVRELVQVEGDGSVDDSGAVREPVKELTHPQTNGSVTSAPSIVKFDVPLTYMWFGEPITASDLVSQLAGSLGPAQPDELEYFNSFDLTWQRFAE